MPVESGSMVMLGRIAAALGQPVSAFLRPRGLRPEDATQASELVEAFQSIRDPDARARCLAFVRASSDARADRS